MRPPAVCVAVRAEDVQGETNADEGDAHDLAAPQPLAEDDEGKEGGPCRGRVVQHDKDAAPRHQESRIQ